MNLRAEIENAFGPQAFARPLFYSWPGGLRFELSETGGMIEQFLTAMRKSITICGDIFQGDASFVACLRIHSGRNRFAHRSTLRALKSAGIDTPSALCIWSEEIDNEEWFSEEEPEYWVNVAFEASVASIQVLLWCAWPRTSVLSNRVRTVLSTCSICPSESWSFPMTTEAWTWLEPTPNYFCSFINDIKSGCSTMTAQRWKPHSAG